jgi:hypothetical protein
MEVVITAHSCHVVKSKKKNKDIPVRDRGGTYGCETSRLPHFLDNPLTDGGDVSLTASFTTRKIPSRPLLFTDKYFVRKDTCLR